MLRLRYTTTPSMARPSIFRLLVFLFLHLACFFTSSANPKEDHRPPHKRRKVSPVSSSPPSSSSTTTTTTSPKPLSFISYLRRLLTKPSKHAQPHPPEVNHRPTITTEPPKRGSFRNELYPCTACGEVLTQSALLDHHKITHHALSDLLDSARSIVTIIFHSGWPANPPAILRILKINNTPRTLACFEDHREAVRCRAASRPEDARCVADGNERLRFYCSTVVCSLGRDGHPVICGAQYCSMCSIVRHGFSGKQAELDGISTYSTSWGAHVAVPEELEREFEFMHVKRVMVVCRVIAGRVARCGEEEEEGMFDSVVPMRARGGPRSSWAEEEEFLVFQARAVLPCFIIVYSV